MQNVSHSPAFEEEAVGWIVTRAHFKTELGGANW